MLHACGVWLTLLLLLLLLSLSVSRSPGREGEVREGSAEGCVRDGRGLRERVEVVHAGVAGFRCVARHGSHVFCQRSKAYLLSSSLCSTRFSSVSVGLTV